MKTPVTHHARHPNYPDESGAGCLTRTPSLPRRALRWPRPGATRKRRKSGPDRRLIPPTSSTSIAREGSEMWSDDEAMEAWKRSCAVWHGLEGMKQAMSYAVELVAARGGDNVPSEADLLAQCQGASINEGAGIWRREAMRARSQAAALGGTVATLQAKVAELEPHVERAEHHKATATKWLESAKQLRAEVERLKAMVAMRERERDRAHAETDRAESLIAAIRERANDEAGMMRAYDVEAEKIRKALLSVGRWVLEGDAPNSSAPLNGSPFPNSPGFPDGSEEAPQKEPRVVMLNITDNGQTLVLSERGVTGLDGRPLGKRYPCSATCTHDDARTPGHPERISALSKRFATEAGGVLASDESPSELVNDRSAAWEAMHPNGSCTCAGEGICAWCDDASKSEEMNAAFERGIDAMRAACWEAVQEYLNRSGLATSSPAMRDHLKAAIEGVAP